jgi:hypothetical protein
MESIKLLLLNNNIKIKKLKNYIDISEDLNNEIIKTIQLLNYLEINLIYFQNNIKDVNLIKFKKEVNNIFQQIDKFIIYLEEYSKLQISVQK